MGSCASLISRGFASLNAIAAIVGPNGQSCGPTTDDNDPDACLINSDGSFNGLTGEEIECEENYDCCLCSSIVCGAADGSSFCDKFVVNGDFGALGVTGIEIYGDPDDGVKIECGGDNSCQQIGLMGSNVQDIKCGGDDSCSEATLDVSCTVDDPCKVECDGPSSCLNANIAVSNVDSFICGTDNACEGATITVTDPTNDFKLECKGANACANVDLKIILTAASSVTELESIECDDVSACAGASLSFSGSSGVSIENCECGDEGGCDDTTGLPAICENIAATTAPVTP